MKLMLLLLGFIPCLAFSQQPISFREEMKEIIGAEKRTASASINNRLAGTAASANFDVKHYKCEWQVNPWVRYITGKVTPTFIMTAAGNSITLDLSTQLTVDSILYHNSKINYQHQPGDALVIIFPASIAQGAKDSVAIFYKGVPPVTGFNAVGQWYHDGVPVLWTLSEPYGAKEWWPCKNGLTDKADSVDLFITHPAVFTASSNGMVQSRTVTDTMATTHFHHTYPIASYLVGMAVTNYAIDDDTIMVDNKSYRFISYAYPEAVGIYFGQEIYTKNAFRIYTKLFGEYPFAREKYGNTQFSWPGGIEHQTNSFIRNTSPAISAHELGHQWFGDRVTCGNWAHIWLNEGFATYASGLYTEVYHPPFYRGFLQGTLDVVVSEPGGSVYVTDTTDVNRIFDGRLSYNKGAFVVHMLRWVLGDSVLFKGLRQYLSDPALSYGFATTEDLQRNLEQASGKDLSKFFQKWVYGEGYANYYAEWTQNNNNWVKLRLDQTTSHPSVSFYEMPVMLEFRAAGKTQRVVVDHRYSGQEFNIQLDFKPDSVDIDPDLWLLAKVKTSKKTTGPSQPDIITIYPNPAPGNGIVLLQNPTGSKLFVRLMNAAGQLVYKKDIATNGQDEKINLPLEHLPRGTYMLELRNDKGLRQVKKILH